MALPRVGALRLAPDGSWLAAAVQTLSADGKKYLTSIWRIDAQGGPARRLTRSAEGEASPRFLPDGSLLFTSRRPDPGRTKRPDGDAGDVAALWLLPAGGGEARVVAALPGGVTAAEMARDASAVVVGSPVLPAAGNGGSAADDARLRQERKDAGITAILHESAPVRFWDHDLGPDQPRLFALDPDQVPETDIGWAGGDQDPRWPTTPGWPKGPNGRRTRPAARPDPGAGAGAGRRGVRADAGRRLGDHRLVAMGPGGRVALRAGHDRRGQRQAAGAAVSVPEFDFESPRVSPDGRFIACQREQHATAERPVDITVVLLDARRRGGGRRRRAGRDLLPGLDRWPGEPAWSHDSRALYFAADDGGRRPVFRVDVDTGEVTRVTARRRRVHRPEPRAGRPVPVRAAGHRGLAAHPGPHRPDRQPAAEPAALDCPGTPVTVPGRLEEIEAAADDGQPVRSWLVLPEAASADRPAPLLLWVHGGPMSSWNTWSWRWNPWLMAARGYAVLLPDPALSTGYGQAFIARAHRDWGARPFADIMAVTDAALARPDIDADRVAMMGGSYGGYMANWMAGHTDRFKAIVSHAGLWALDQMFGTTDHPMFWRPQFGDPLTEPEMYEANSPHRHIAQIRTPMLVIHGNKDYRVPVGEALRLWWDLSRHGAEAKFLYFPDENHWILTPGNARIWYETVFAFLAQHVLGQQWQRPGCSDLRRVPGAVPRG